MKRLYAFVTALAVTLTLHLPAAAQLSPFGQPARNYALTFSEEFNSGFNSSLWNDKMWYDVSNPTINYAVEGGSLKIWPERDSYGQFFNRTIDTDGKWSQRYGYFEIEAKLPYGRGPWPAFWLFAHVADRRPEIDIMEAYPGGGPDSGWSDANLHPTMYAMTIWKNATVLAGSKKLGTADLSAGFHKYALRWEAGKVTFYFDGVAAYSRNVSMTDSMFIVLSLWFGSASGTPDATTPTGRTNAYVINYVRAWRIVR